MMERMWYYLRENQQIGPVHQAEVARLLAEGILPPDVYVWAEGMPEWQPANRVAEFGGQGPMASVAAGYLQPGTERPAAVTVFGVLNIIFGSFGLLCMPCAISVLFMPQEPGPFAFETGPVGFTLFTYIVGLGLAVWLLATGIGLLYQKQWARQWAFWGGCFWVVWKIFSTIMNFVLVGGEIFKIAEGEDTAAMLVGMVFGFVFGIFISLVYPVLLVIFMKRPNVIAACQR